jgi:hypothetical protein
MLWCVVMMVGGFVLLSAAATLQVQRTETNHVVGLSTTCICAAFV